VARAKRARECTSLPAAACTCASGLCPVSTVIWVLVFSPDKGGTQALSALLQESDSWRKSVGYVRVMCLP
jgi:hypothetical protein